MFLDLVQTARHAMEIGFKGKGKNYLLFKKNLYIIKYYKFFFSFKNNFELILILRTGVKS